MVEVEAARGAEAGAHDPGQGHAVQEVLDDGEGAEEVNAEVSGAIRGDDVVVGRGLTGIHISAIRIPANMRTSIQKLQARLRKCEQHRRRILRRLLSEKELAVGTVSWVDRTCGKPGCHCAHGPGHRQMQFLFKDANGRRRCRLVRKADHKRMSLASTRYRAFREGLKELKTIEKEESKILVALRRARQLTYK